MGTCRRFAVLVLTLLTVAGCGLLGDEQEPAAQNDSGQPRKVKVAVLPTVAMVSKGPLKATGGPEGR